MTRSAIRELVFKLLFRVEFQDISDMENQAEYFADEYIEKYIQDKNIGNNEGDQDTEDSKAAELLNGVNVSMDEVKRRANTIISLLPDIDKTISDNMTGWTIDRVGKVELTILRLATYEIVHDEDVPGSVAINEAVELAKKYGQSDSASFINGVLGKIAKKIESI